MNAPPEVVFDVLATPEKYAHWVVGATKIRRADQTWPRKGAQFHHTQGAFGIGLPDSTQVVSASRPRQLILEARFRPFAINKVEMRLRKRGRGTCVTMVEYPIGGIAQKLDNPLMHAAMHVRNIESLRRLRKMAERSAEDS